MREMASEWWELDTNTHDVSQPSWYGLLSLATLSQNYVLGSVWEEKGRHIASPSYRARSWKSTTSKSLTQPGGKVGMHTLFTLFKPIFTTLYCCNLASRNGLPCCHNYGFLSWIDCETVRDSPFIFTLFHLQRQETCLIQWALTHIYVQEEKLFDNCNASPHQLI